MDGCEYVSAEAGVDKRSMATRVSVRRLAPRRQWCYLHSPSEEPGVSMSGVIL